MMKFKGAVDPRGKFKPIIDVNYYLKKQTSFSKRLVVNLDQEPKSLLCWEQVRKYRYENGVNFL